MAKRRGNPNWGKPEPFMLGTTVSSFESLVKSLGLSPDQYENSAALKEPLLAALKSGDTVLVKGSFGSKMSVIIDALKALDSRKAQG